MIRTTLPYTDPRTEGNVIGKNLFEIASLGPKEQDRYFDRKNPGAPKMRLRLGGFESNPLLFINIGDTIVACFAQNTLADALGHARGAPQGRNSLSPYHTVRITHHADTTEVEISELDRTACVLVEEGESTGYQGRRLVESMPMGAALLNNWLLRDKAPLFGTHEDGVYLIDGLRATSITPDIRLLSFLADVDAAFEAQKSVEFRKEFECVEKIHEAEVPKTHDREIALDSFFAEP